MVDNGGKLGNGILSCQLDWQERRIVDGHTSIYCNLLELQFFMINEGTMALDKHKMELSLIILEYLVLKTHLFNI